MRVIKFAKTGAVPPSLFDAIPNEFVQDGPLGPIEFVCVGGGGMRVINGAAIGADITFSGEISWDFSLPRLQSICGKRFLGLNRMYKATYNALLNYTAKDLEGYVPVMSWNETGFFTPEKGQQYLLRPAAGARGIGFIPLDDHGKSLETIGQFLVEHKDKPKEDFLALLEKNGIRMATEGLREGEALATNINSGWEVVQVVPDVVEEWRIMTDYLGKPHGAVKRTRSETTIGLLQARGCGQDVSNYQECADWSIDPAISSKLLQFFDNLRMPMSSFDLFLTKDGGWGFFEACYEFGRTSLPTGWLPAQARKFVYHAATCDLE